MDAAKLAALSRPIATVGPPVAADGTGPAAAAACANLAELRAQALACTQCPNLAAARKRVVFGVGNESADLMFVGEAPGADEDAGEPFVGKAGQLLTKIIQTWASPGYRLLGNILKCRPDTPGQRYGNRPPTGGNGHLFALAASAD